MLSITATIDYVQESYQGESNILIVTSVVVSRVSPSNPDRYTS
jgi:hypothetical protein